MSGATYNLIEKAVLIIMGLCFFVMVVTLIVMLILKIRRAYSWERKRVISRVLFIPGALCCLMVASMAGLQALYNNSSYNSLNKYYGDRLSQENIENLLGSGSLNGDLEPGKVALYDIREEKFFYTNADKPEDVDYVVLARFSKICEGTYNDGAKAFRYDCAYTVVDAEKWKSVKHGEITGDSPPSVKSGGGDRTGPKPKAEDIIDDFIN